MTLAEVEIQSTGPSTCSVKVDGKDLAAYVVGVDIRERVGAIPNVTLHLVGLSRVELGVADVVLPDYVGEGLQALGWTPPAGRELLGEAQPPHAAAREYWISEILARQAEWLEARIRQLANGESLCVHDTPSDWNGRIAAHVLATGEPCEGKERRSVYGPMTPEIRAQVEALAGG